MGYSHNAGFHAAAPKKPVLSFDAPHVRLFNRMPIVRAMMDPQRGGVQVNYQNVSSYRLPFIRIAERYLTHEIRRRLSR